MIFIINDTMFREFVYKRLSKYVQHILFMKPGERKSSRKNSRNRDNRRKVVPETRKSAAQIRVRNAADMSHTYNEGNNSSFQFFARASVWQSLSFDKRSYLITLVKTNTGLVKSLTDGNFACNLYQI